MHSPEIPSHTRPKLASLNTEEGIKSLIDAQNMPQELKDTWYAHIEDAEDDEDLLVRIEQIKTKIAKREQIHEKKFITPQTTEMTLADPNLQLEASQVFKNIAEEARNGQYEMIGDGATACVYASKKHPELCYKIITSAADYSLSSNVQGEMRMQNTISQLNVNGVRAPKPYYYHMDEQNHLCIMERMPAATLEEIRLGQKELPKDFDIEKRLDDLRTFIAQMHEDLGIYHRDLHDRNIMFDLNNGTIVDQITDSYIIFDVD